MNNIKSRWLAAMVSLFFTAGTMMAQPQEKVTGSVQMSLEECRTIALEHSEKMQRAGNALRQAEMDRQIAFANYLPKLDGTLTSIYTKDTEMMGSEIQMRGMWMAGLTVQQPIYAGGQLTAANKLAGITQTMRSEEVRKTRQQLIADVDNAYYSLVAVGAKVRMVEALALQLKSLREQVQVTIDAEMATNVDLLRISAKESEVQYQLQKARNGRTLCQLALASCMGLSLDEADIIPSDTIISITAPQNLDDDISQRPDARILQQSVEVSKQQSKIARSSMLPTVGMQLGMSWYGNVKMKGMIENSDGSSSSFSKTLHGSSPMALLSVQVPLFHWGAEYKKYKKSKVDIENAELKAKEELRGMHVEVRRAIRNISDGYAMCETAEKARSEADENLRVMRKRYESQMVTMTDLLEAQAGWQQAHSNLIEAQTQYKLYETEYLRVTGRE